MEPIPVIAIFDIGKTNKKLFLFDESYVIAFTRTVVLKETIDEDGHRCENVNSLCDFVMESLKEIFSKKEFQVRAVNFSAYGASFVYIDQLGNPPVPLYNYLKPFPRKLQDEFYDAYGGELLFSRQTASPALGSLNAGLQLYRLKKEQPFIFGQVRYALHLPQYLSWLVSGWACSDITSIGCHTAIWDFFKNDYHDWLQKENVLSKMAPFVSPDTAIEAKFDGYSFLTGPGLHDSSAALIPYLLSFPKLFMLISTGTWNISLNPFNDSPLTDQELRNDCLCCMSYKGNAVKASRLFAGYEHGEQVKRIAAHFNKSFSYYEDIEPDLSLLEDQGLQFFFETDLRKYNSFEEAYHQLVVDLVCRQAISSRMIQSENIKRVYVDGGFSRNKIFMKLLATSFPDLEVFAATIAEASALGAALVIHKHWNSTAIADDIISLKRYLPV
jgi:sugar (pentulose or hexulose) kinase